MAPLPHRFTALCCACLCASPLLVGSGDSQPIFSAMPAEEGMPTLPVFQSRSYIFADYDNDGWPDQFRLEISGPGRGALLHSEAGRRFVDNTAIIHAPDLPNAFKGGGGVAADYDNDGDLDLFVPNGSYEAWGMERNGLLRNDRGRFTDVAMEAGLTDAVPTDNAIWLDYDRDGFVDLYTGNLGAPEVRNILYRNQGDGTFRDVTEEAGLLLHFPNGGSNGALIGADFTGDGWPDLYVAVFNALNRLLVNDGQGQFQEGTSGEIADPGEAFHAVAGDIDNDGDLDIFQAAGGSEDTAYRSLMLLNLGEGDFLDVTEAIGLASLGAVNAAGTGMADIDNDGDLDLVVNVGFSNPIPFLFLNDGDGTFIESTSLAGLENVKLFPTVFGDYDRDGSLDGLNRDGLFRNNGSDHHYLRVELVGVQSNRSGIGARIAASSGDLYQVRQILGGYGYSQDELVAHFGLGDRARVDRLEIRWPSGQVDLLTDIPADQQIRVFEGRRVYHPAPPSTWEHGLPDQVLAGKELPVDLIVRPTPCDPLGERMRLTADLSSLGGRSNLPLDLREDGTYALRGKVVVPRSSGLKDLSVDIEQNAPPVPCWRRLTQTIEVLPTEPPSQDLVVLADGLENGWRIETTGLTWDLQEGDDAYQGGTFLAMDGEKNWVLRFVAPEGFDSGAYQAIRLAFFPLDPLIQNRAFSMFGTVDDNRLQQVSLEAASSNWTVMGAGGRGINSSQPKWQIAWIPLEIFAPREPLKSFSLVGVNFVGRAYIDDVRLVPALPLGEDLVIFGDELRKEWELFPQSKIELDPEATAETYQGNKALALLTSGNWKLSYRPLVPVNSRKYDALRFAFHPGNAAGMLLDLSLNFHKVSLLPGDPEGIHVDLEDRSWQVVEVPLAAVGVDGPLSTITFSGRLEGTAYLDDIRLVAVEPPTPVTAVTETHAVSRPLSFTLAQNYPNPFNSATVIRFALPAAADVNLAIFNLTGQQVATLAQGARETGTYTVSWDGRDDDGRELASGVYLYRLRMGNGQQVETRKLLLIQ